MWYLQLIVPLGSLPVGIQMCPEFYLMFYTCFIEELNFLVVTR